MEALWITLAFMGLIGGIATIAGLLCLGEKLIDEGRPLLGSGIVVAVIFVAVYAIALGCIGNEPRHGQKTMPAKAEEP